MQQDTIQKLQDLIARHKALIAEAEVLIDALAQQEEVAEMPVAAEPVPTVPEVVEPVAEVTTAEVTTAEVTMAKVPEVAEPIVEATEISKAPETHEPIVEVAEPIIEVAEAPEPEGVATEPLAEAAVVAPEPIVVAPEPIVVAPEPVATVAEVAAQAPTTIRVDEMLSRQNSRDLYRAFTLNDKFRFRRELFGNSDAQMAETLDTLSAMKQYAEAEEYIYGDLAWDPENEDVKEFMSIIRNHFA